MKNSIRKFEVAVLVAAVCLGTTASAQEGDGDSNANTESKLGLKIGEGRLHPFFTVEGRFDSAAGYKQNPALQQVLFPEIVARFRPGILFDLDTSSTSVAFAGNAEYVWYTGALTSDSYKYSRFQADVSLDTAFNKDGPVEFQLGDQLVRSDRTTNVAAPISLLSLYNDAHVAIPIHPGGGALEFAPKVNVSVELFEPLIQGNLVGCTSDPKCDTTQVARMNYVNVRPGLAARWRFFPKTALMLDSTVDVRGYIADPTGLVNRSPLLWKSQLGLVGLVTTKFSVTLLAGFGMDFRGVSANGTGAMSFLGQIELGFLPSESFNIRLGGMRSLNPVPIYGTYADTRAYLTSRLNAWSNKFHFDLSGGFDYLTFYGGSGRNDIVVSVTAGPKVDFTQWFAVGAGYTLSLRNSISGDVTAGLTQFIRHEALLNLTFQY